MNKKQAVFLILVTIAVIAFFAFLVSWGTSLPYYEAFLTVLTVFGIFCLIILLAIGIALVYDWLGSHKKNGGE